MRWLKRGWLQTSIILTSVILLLVLTTWIPVVMAHAQVGALGVETSITVTVQATPTVDATVTALTKEQLTQEVNQQQHTLSNWLWSNVATILSSFLSTLVVVIGVLFGFWQWREGRKDAQNKESEDRQVVQDKELKDRQDEREKRAEERFQAAVTGLGDDKEGARIGAAILLRTFLRPGYEQFYTQTFDLAVANLRLPRDSKLLHYSLWSLPSNSNTSLPLTTLRQALIVVFKEAFPLARSQEKRNPQSLDATGIQLDNAYLREADLQQAWMPQVSLCKADLREANLKEANLREANLSGAWLCEADLSGADLSGADLSGADFNEANLSRAKLFWANLNKANLYGVKLCWTDLYNADLSGAELSEADLSGTNIKNILSLKGTDLRGTHGLTKEQLTACKAKGAIIDEDPTTSSSQSTIAPSSPPQNNDTHTPSDPSAQRSTPSPDSDGNSAVSSQQEPES